MPDDLDQKIASHKQRVAELQALFRFSQIEAETWIESEGERRETEQPAR